MRESLRDWLSDVGHQVFVAGDSEQALEVIFGVRSHQRLTTCSPLRREGDRAGL